MLIFIITILISFIIVMLYEFFIVYDTYKKYKEFSFSYKIILTLRGKNKTFNKSLNETLKMFFISQKQKIKDLIKDLKDDISRK